MPTICRQSIDLKAVKLIGYDQTKQNDKANLQSYVHFFLDDYKFEAIWKDPEWKSSGSTRGYYPHRSVPFIPCQHRYKSIIRFDPVGAEHISNIKGFR